MSYALYDFASCRTKDKDFTDLHLNSLESLAAPEDWTFVSWPDKRPLQILFNYIHYTFQRIKDEFDTATTPEEQNKKIAITTNDKGNKVACFNTGLFTQLYEPIFGLFDQHQIPGFQPWILRGFYPESDWNLQYFTSLPERAFYFENPSELVYDVRYKIRDNRNHIFQDKENLKRFPSELQQDQDWALKVYTGAIDTLNKQVATNYKIAICNR